MRNVYLHSVGEHADMLPRARVCKSMCVHTSPGNRSVNVLTRALRWVTA